MPDMNFYFEDGLQLPFLRLHYVCKRPDGNVALYGLGDPCFQIKVCSYQCPTLRTS